MKETILLYNIMKEELSELYRDFCDKQEIALITVPEREYAVPLGFLAYGSDEQKAPYTENNPGAAGKMNSGFNEPMLIFAGFTNQRLTQVLRGLKESGLPQVSLKAVLTEHNALWDSVTLYGHLSEERDWVRSQSGSSS